MARPLRVEFAGALYHLTARGNGRGVIFVDDRDCERFLDLLARSLERFEVDLHAFVLMGNHFHLLAQTRQANLSRWMHWLLAAYTIGFQYRHKRVGHGHLFQGRFKSIVVEADGYLLALGRYIHLNPVRGKLLGRGEIAERRSRLRAWRWSSYAGYAGLRNPFPFVSEALVLSELGTWLPSASSRTRLRQEYRRFVERGLIEAQASPLEEVAAGVVLGGESFVQWVRDRLADEREAKTDLQKRRQREDVSGLATLVKVPDLTAHAASIVGLVATHYGLPAGRITDAKAGRSLEARGVALVLVREKIKEWSYREIGEYFGGVNYAGVAQRVARLYRAEHSGRGGTNSLVLLRARCQDVKT